MIKVVLFGLVLCVAKYRAKISKVILAPTKPMTSSLLAMIGYPTDITGNLVLGASGRSPAKTLSMIRRRARVHGRRLAWRFGWQRSGDRSVLGCAVRASGGVAEPQRARV